MYNKNIFILQGAFPARLKCVFIVSSPLWFRAPFAVLRLFVREKLRERVCLLVSSRICIMYKMFVVHYLILTLIFLLTRSAQ